MVCYIMVCYIMVAYNQAKRIV